MNIVWHEVPIEYLKGYHQIEGYKLLKIGTSAYPVQYVTEGIITIDY